MAEERKEYGSGWFGDFLNGSAKKRLDPKNDELFNAKNLLAETEHSVLVGSGVREDEAQEYLSERLAQNEADHAATAKAINTMAITNTAINVASMIPIAAGGMSKISSSLANTTVGAKLSAKLASFGSSGTRVSDMVKGGTDLIKDGHVLKGVGQYAKAGTTAVGRAAVKTFKVVDAGFEKLGGKIAGKAAAGAAKDAGNIAVEVLDDTGKVIGKGIAKEVGKAAADTAKTAAAGSKGILGLTRTAVGGIVSKGAYFAPIAAAQVYTRGRVDKMDKNLSDAITLALDRTDYLNTEGGKLTGEAGQAYNEWNNTYSAAMAGLKDQLDKGEITQAQYDQLYEEQSVAQAEALKVLDEKYPVAAKQMITEGEAYRTADKAAKIQADIDGVGQHDSQVKDLMEQYPDAKELYQEEYEKVAAMDTGSSFSNFITSMHAALIHYLPGFAYLEAAAVKAADVALGFVANKVPVISDVVSYQEHYQGQSLTTMASKIVDTAEMRYEKQQEVDALTAESEFKQKSWQESAEETRGSDGLQAAPC